MFVDTGVKPNCWNGRESFGEICVHCGCCSENKEERLKNRIYKLNMWICDSMETYRICMGIPKHLLDTGCVTSNEIMKYTDNGNKDLTAMHISNLIIYDKPKELSEFHKPCINPGAGYVLCVSLLILKTMMYFQDV